MFNSMPGCSRDKTISATTLGESCEYKSPGGSTGKLCTVLPLVCESGTMEQCSLVQSGMCKRTVVVGQKLGVVVKVQSALRYRAKGTQQVAKKNKINKNYTTSTNQTIITRNFKRNL